MSTETTESGNPIDPIDPIDELGGLSAAERDQLADDLRRIQAHFAEEADRSLIETLRSMDAENTAYTAIQQYIRLPVDKAAFREHATDGSPCWCGPTTESAETVSPDAADSDATSGADPWDTEEVRTLVAAASTLHFAYFDHQAMMPDALDRLIDAVRSFDGVDLRQQIEEAVERLRYTVHSDPIDREAHHDVLDTEPFLTELDRIFGKWHNCPDEPFGMEAATAPSEPPTLQMIDLTEALRESIRVESERCYGTSPKAVRASRGESAAGRPSDTDPGISPLNTYWSERQQRLEAVNRRASQGSVTAAVSRPNPIEHESAAERRERESAKYETQDGRIEGLDR